MCTPCIGAVGVVISIVRVHAATWLELVLVPVLVLFVANGVEWRAHKDLLHHRQKPLHELYDRHTPEHHMVYGYDDMEIRSFKELKLVLIPAVGIFAAVVSMAAPAWLI